MSFSFNNLFDAIVVGVLVFGIYRGRKTGALPQIFGLARWLLMLGICSFLYAAPVRWLGKFNHLQPDIIGLMVYPLELALVWGVLELATHRFEYRMEKKQVFGPGENFIAMLAGAARFFVVLLTALAWLHGKYVTEKELHNADDAFGEHVLATLHNDVFHGSMSGKFVHAYLKPVLMEAPLPVDYGEPPEAKPAKNRKLHLKEADLGDGPDKAKAAAKAPEPPAAKPPSPSGSKEMVYHNLTYFGFIIGADKKRTATINNRIFPEGEVADIKIDNQGFKLRCSRITDEAVTVQFVGKTNVITLKMNVATDLDGKPVPPPAVPAPKR